MDVAAVVRVWMIVEERVDGESGVQVRSECVAADEFVRVEDGVDGVERGLWTQRDFVLLDAFGVEFAYRDAGRV